MTNDQLHNICSFKCFFITLQLLAELEQITTRDIIICYTQDLCHSKTRCKLFFNSAVKLSLTVQLNCTEADDISEGKP